MILTQCYTNITGIPAGIGQDKKDRMIHLGRMVCQAIDLVLPIVLLIIGILGVIPQVPIPAITGYCLLSAGGVLGLSQMLLVIHQMLAKGSCVLCNKNYGTVDFQHLEHFHFFHYRTH